MMDIESSNNIIKDSIFYNLLALCDVFRVGKVREIKQAKVLFQQITNHKNHVQSQ